MIVQYTQICEWLLKLFIKEININSIEREILVCMYKLFYISLIILLLILIV